MLSLFFLNNLKMMEKVSPSTPRMNFSTALTPKRTMVHRLQNPVQITKKKDDQEPSCSSNPFDVKAESLYLPACSPSIFATFQRNKKTDGSLRWSIEHLSVLYPAEIDETSLPDSWVDEDQEKKAQKAIDAFFSQNSIVPSPWSSSPKDGKNAKTRRRECMTNIFQDCLTSEASTQTMLSIPPHIDLRKILSNFYSCDEDGESNSSRDDSDSFSSSSLRRKLFTNDEECLSSEKQQNKVTYSVKRRSGATIYMQSAQSTPASDILSSSPVSPPNCSDLCNIFTSPPVSPISAAQNLSPLEADDESFVDSVQVDYRTPKRVPLNETSKDIQMSFCADSQENAVNTLYTSEKQDTGYATASISDINLGCITRTTSQSSFSNMDRKYGFVSSIEAVSTDDSNQIQLDNCGALQQFGHVSRITPVTELMNICELSSSCHDMSYQTIDGQLGQASEGSPFSSTKPNPCNLQTYPWLPSCCSTPAHCSHS